MSDPMSDPTADSTADPTSLSTSAEWCNARCLVYVERAMTATNAQLTMYSTTWCGYCARLKAALKSAGIGWTEIDIEADPSAAEFVGSVNGGNHVVPTVKFADGSTLTNPSLKQVQAKLAA
jgi:mycoredoxin